MPVPLGYIPEIYPDELFYSWLGRFHVHLGYPPWAKFLKHLFGRRHVPAVIELPSGLNALAERLPIGFGWSAERLLDETTLFRYFTAFQPKEIQSLARSKLLIGESSDLFLKLGVARFSPTSQRVLKYCPLCQQDMYSQKGELWWRRVHQLASVYVCPDHDVPLLLSDVHLHEISRHEFVPPTAVNCSKKLSVVRDASDEKTRKHLYAIAVKSSELLNGHDFEKNFAQWTVYYRSLLQERGFTKSPSAVNQTLLEEAFVGFYGNALNRFNGVVVESGKPGPWLSSIVRKHRHAFHPLQHFLVQNFLHGQRIRQKNPFGFEPWVCMNPLGTLHPEQHVVQLSTHRNKANTVGVFTCDCGYSYTRKFDQRDQVLGAVRYRSYGSMLKPLLQQCLVNGWSLRAIGKYLKLDPKTVVRECARLGLGVPWRTVVSLEKKESSNAEVVVKKIDHHKKLKSAKPQKRCARSATMDWTAIDDSWVQKIDSLVSEILRSAKPIRITLSLLERKARKKGWLQKRLNKLPRTQKFLGKVVESDDEFKNRRIHWAINELKRKDSTVKAWQVMRLAGLTGTSLEEIRECLRLPQLKRKSSACAG